MPSDFRPNVSGVARCQPYTHQFGKLGRPCVGGDDSFFGHPMFVNGAQCSDGPLTFRGFISTDEDTVRLFQVPNCCSLCQELWVGQNLKKWQDVRNLPSNTSESHSKAVAHTCKLRLGLVLASKIRRMLSAARTGTVLFSVTIL